MKNIFSILVLLVTASSCSTDELIKPTVAEKSSELRSIEKSSLYVCTNGLQITSGSYTNLGGNGGVSLTASAITLSGNSGIKLPAPIGTLYRKSISYSDLSVGKMFIVDNDASGDIWVRVVGYTSSNRVLLLSAKKMSGISGDIYIEICNLSPLSAYTHIYFEVYAITASGFAWRWQ